MSPAKTDIYIFSSPISTPYTRAFFNSSSSKIGLSKYSCLNSTLYLYAYIHSRFHLLSFFSLSFFLHTILLNFLLVFSLIHFAFSFKHCYSFFRLTLSNAVFKPTNSVYILPSFTTNCFFTVQCRMYTLSTVRFYL